MILQNPKRLNNFSVASTDFIFGAVTVSLARNDLEDREGKGGTRGDWQELEEIEGTEMDRGGIKKRASRRNS